MPDGYNISGLVLAVVPVSLLLSMVFWLRRLIVSRQPPSRWKEIGEALAEARAHAERLERAGYITEKKAGDVRAQFDKFDSVHNELWLDIDLWRTYGLYARIRHPARTQLLRSCSSLKMRIDVLREELRQHSPGASTEFTYRADIWQDNTSTPATLAPSTSTAASSERSPSSLQALPSPATLASGDDNKLELDAYGTIRQSNTAFESAGHPATLHVSSDSVVCGGGIASMARLTPESSAPDTPPSHVGLGGLIAHDPAPARLDAAPSSPPLPVSDLAPLTHASPGPPAASTHTPTPSAVAECTRDPGEQLRDHTQTPEVPPNASHVKLEVVQTQTVHVGGVQISPLRPEARKRHVREQEQGKKDSGARVSVKDSMRYFMQLEGVNPMMHTWPPY